MKLGRAIRILREAKGLKVKDLAERAAVSVSLVSLIESGDREPSLGVLKKIADSLAVPFDVLVAIVQPGEGTLATTHNGGSGIRDALKRLSDAEDMLRDKLG